MKRFQFVFHVAVIALSLAWLMPTAVAAGSGSGGTFTIGIGVALDTLNPAQQTSTAVMNVIDYDLQTLVTFDKKVSSTQCLRRRGRCRMTVRRSL